MYTNYFLLFYFFLCCNSTNAFRLYFDHFWKQQYVANPLLLKGGDQDGYKFDLRIYVTVTSFNPLRIYMHEDGLTRFATAPYDASPDHYNNRYMHLTNYSVNKHNDGK